MKKVALLDVNVLVALFQPEHVHHELAHDWFAENRHAGWATCPVTETGLVRLLANPRFHAGGVAVSAVVERLRRLQSDPAHEWWEASISLTDPNLFQLTAIRGHRQVTDVYLAGLAHARDGKLVTFDRAVLWSAVSGAKATLIEVLSESAE
ncbi:MAG: TA system VapC family ribonuclease toxin [Vicinamibacteraceae bacterium]